MDARHRRPRGGGPAQRLHGRLAARTGLPLPGGRHVGVLDTMIITKWEPPRLVEVQHTGRLDPRARASSRSSRAASTRPSSGPSGCTCPTATSGEVGWFLVRPFALFGIRRSLKRFAAVAARSR